jgi:hypothetical protein
MAERTFHPFMRLPTELRAKIFDTHFESFTFLERHIALPLTQRNPKGKNYFVVRPRREDAMVVTRTSRQVHNQHGSSPHAVQPDHATRQHRPSHRSNQQQLEQSQKVMRDLQSP